MTTTIVTNSDGREFLVRKVTTGIRYGLNDCLVHDEEAPMVEFYDRTYRGETFGPRGQFVGRYYLSTLTGRGGGGLNLHGGVDNWWVSHANVEEALAVLF
jgi:hypothetical protein